MTADVFFWLTCATGLLLVAAIGITSEILHRRRVRRNWQRFHARIEEIRAEEARRTQHRHRP